MPVTRYHGAAEMPRIPVVSGDGLARRIRELWVRAERFGRPRPPRGVQKFRTIEQAQAARDDALRRRLRQRSPGDAGP